MKFAKEIEHDLVPEWRAKYLDYKVGKSYVKNVARAVAKANGTPRIVHRDTFFSRQNNNLPLNNTYDDGAEIPPTEPLRDSPAALAVDSEDSSGDQKVTTPMLIGRKKGKMDSSDQPEYGSFIPTPPSSKQAHPLELPGPALPSDSDSYISPGTKSSTKVPKTSRPPPRRDPSQRSYSVGVSNSAYEVGQTNPSSQKPHPSGPSKSKTWNSQQVRRLMSTSGGVTKDSSRHLLHRMMSHGRLARSNSPRVDVSLSPLDQVRSRQQEFFQWMDKELDMIETFYQSKEEEAGDRLKVLREQLHVMRNRRIDEIVEARKRNDTRKDDEHVNGHNSSRQYLPDLTGNSQPAARDQLHAWMQPIESFIQNAKSKTRGPNLGPNSRALQQMERTPEFLAQDGQDHIHIESGRDYVRRPHYDHEIPYRTAKRKLKLALKEYYRGLELLKSYALLNQKAFRKINKKYDKAVNARPPLRYMSEKVNKAWFVRSDVVEGHIHAVEDLYSRYFERGNHKVAVGKLRISIKRHGEYTNNAFRSGLFIGIGAVFAIQGLIYASDLLFYSDDSTIQLQTTYLLQIYGGYFLALYLFGWFCLDCCIWTRNKINYSFIFEFDSRHNLDWRELVEFPSFLLLVLGLFLWLNFTRCGTPAMFLYYPVVLIFATVVTIFLPAPVLFHRSRRWFVYAHWRLLLAGFYPVEFRDFFLGDMYCSLTYFMSNIELFFCLYAQHWNDPLQCNSTHSRLLGFFTTLPGIWRALQCIRRYYDTRSVFPHLVNCGKYGMTIMYYMTLSLYRMQEDESLLALFITFATINALYTSTWDLAMDWSLCQPDAQKRFLRNVRGYKPTWPYYLAMIIDPILRFNWVFYIIYTHDLQHSSIASFLIAFSEVSRRGMWTLFRVENEHCANVAHFKASRDIPLPYPPLSATMESDTFANQHDPESPEESRATTTSASPTLSRHRSRTVAVEEGENAAGPSSSGMRRRAPTRTLTSIFAEAHTQDFEKKRKPGGVDKAHGNSLRRERTGSEDDDRVVSSDDEDDEEDAMRLSDVDDLKRKKGRMED